MRFHFAISHDINMIFLPDRDDKREALAAIRFLIFVSASLAPEDEILRPLGHKDCLK